jgi:hypothetical protein
MRKTTQEPLLVAVMLFLSTSAYAASIGASFVGDGSGGTTLAPTDLAGIVAQTNWNNISSISTGNVGISGTLLDHGGNSTAVQLQFIANDAWNADGPSDTPDDILMKGILKEGGVGSSMTLSFTNLADGAYDVYVYGNVNGGPVDLDVSIGGTTKYWSEPAAFEGTYTEAASNDPNARAVGDYVKFTGVTPASGGITVTATYQGGSDGLGIAGLQLVTSGSFPANTTPVAIVSQPQPALAAPGSAAMFSVSATGPSASYKWFKNGAPIPGATGSSYTTPAVSLSDDNTRFKVTVSNNINSVTSDEVTLRVQNDPGTRLALLGVSFLGNTGDRNVESWRMAPTDLAGVVPQTNWSNLQWDNWGNVGAPAGGFVGISDPLPDSVGNLTAVLLVANCNDAWNADGATDTPDDRLMKGILKEGGVGSSMTLTFTNLTRVPAFFDVYVYGNVNGGPVDLDVSIGGTTKYWSEPAAFEGTYTEAASTDPSARAEGNYVKFTGVGVTPESGVITITATYQGGSDGLGIAGVQVRSSVAFSANAPTQTKLNVALASDEMVISWTSSASLQLQSRPDLGQGTWADEPTPPVVNGNQKTVSLPATGPARFFRLLGR